jgi:hypothetical protein
MDGLMRKLVVDLTPALKSHAAKLGKSSLSYRPDDLHLTQKGHGSAARCRHPAGCCVSR